MKLDPMSVLHVDPEHIVTLDFETYYADDYTLSKMTTEAYVRDPRFEVIGVGVRIDDGETLWLSEGEFWVWLGKHDLSRCAVLAHHAHFDGLILSHHYDTFPLFWFDTLSMARALHGTEVGGSLGKLSTHYGVGEKGHEVVQAKNKRLRDFSSEELAAYGRYCCNDVVLAKAIFDRMLSDGFPEIELWNIDTTVRMFTEASLVVDRPMLTTFLAEEKQRKASLLARVAQDSTTLSSNDQFAALLFEMGEDPPRKISARTGKEAWAFAKSDPGMKALLEHERDEIRWLAEARIGIKSTINETRTERLLGAGERGPLPIYLKYYGAHTGRWSGGDKINPQNFQRGGVIRNSLMAPEGYALVVADSAQIEARMTAWLAGHDELLEAFSQGRDVYSEFASTAYGRTITKTDKLERFVGKVCVLGLGYSMGWAKFAETMLKGAMGGPPVIFGHDIADALEVDLNAFISDEYSRTRVEKMPSRLPLAERLVHCAVAKEFVDTYRERNAPIVQLWRTCDDVLDAMARDVTVTLGPTLTLRHALMLPNELTLKYPGLRRDDEGYGFMGGGGGKERVRTYGGKITENVVQALARIVVAEQMLYVRGAYGYHVATMTHDEVVLVVPESEAPRALERTLEAMKTPPEWAPGLPLSAEGDFGRRYGEVK
jgi:hypothetical protein